MSNIIELEERKCFDFFWKEISHTDEGFGLIRDNNVQRDMSSIASIGFGLSLVVKEDILQKKRERSEQFALLKQCMKMQKKNMDFSTIFF